MENPENWTSAKFREELQKLGINIPKAWSKSVLKQHTTNGVPFLLK
jgi:hypothetical protein